jgi:hypothetical protein
MRNMLVAALAFGMALAFSVTAQAGDATLNQGASFLEIKIGNVPQIRLDAKSTNVTITGNGPHTITQSASVFQTDTATLQSAAFTGLPLLSALKISLHEGAGSFSDSATVANPVGGGNLTGFGGVTANTGFLTMNGNGFSFGISLGNLGSGGITSTLAPVLNNLLVVTGAPYASGPAVITGITSNVLSVPGLGGVMGVAFTLNLTTAQLATAIDQNSAVNTVTISDGFNNLASHGQNGSIKMVSPFRVKTGNIMGNVAGSLSKTFTFVPEPGTVLLLVTGAVGLAVIGRKRMRK